MPRASRLLAGLLAVLLLGGCATLGVLSELGERLEQDGFTGAGASSSVTPTASEIVVNASGHARLRPDAAVLRAAEITWRTFPRRVDTVTAQVGGRSGSYGRDELATRFGPRDPALDATTLGDDAGSSVRAIGIGLAVGGLLALLAGILLVVWLVRNGRRRRDGRVPPIPRAPVPPRRPPWQPPGPPWQAPPPGPPPPGRPTPGPPPSGPPPRRGP